MMRLADDYKDPYRNMQWCPTPFSSCTGDRKGPVRADAPYRFLNSPILRLAPMSPRRAVPYHNYKKGRIVQLP